MPPAILQGETKPITRLVTAEDSDSLQSSWPFLEFSGHDDSYVASDLVEECAMPTAPPPAPATHPTTISALLNNSNIAGSCALQLQLSLSSCDTDEETSDDGIKEDVNNARHREMKEKANQAKAELIAEPFTVIKSSKSGGIHYEYMWKAVEQSVPALPVSEYSNKLGLRGYLNIIKINFSTAILRFVLTRYSNVSGLAAIFSLFEQRPEDNHILEIFWLLWLGIATEQLETMNKAIDTQNQKSHGNKPMKLRGCGRVHL
jgi:hypothetical protein